MFYVQRDAQGLLVRVEAAPYAGSTDMLAADDHEIQAWFANEVVENSLNQLKQSDMEMIRVLDDLIQVLTSKGVIRVTDLPPAAQAKLMDRTQAREALGGLSHLINDDEMGLI
ncbi:MAG: tryptophan synthase subunit beta [Pseudomonas sp.]|uniref:tryptophan synthase subunit beta n=1 Tax=Pseudomonas sp. TaxID=306 RepID=UPI002609484F|nr:tryptophan synthase subunit beta [Pseudomonas sp.]MDB6047967.1 tryptophan synthase subunit beta [Pseudomonas sp.]